MSKFASPRLKFLGSHWENLLRSAIQSNRPLFRAAGQMLSVSQPIRMIHHLSATGGTLISRCLAAMPNVVLLSELHPLTASRVPFYPLDPLGQIATNYRGLLPSDKQMYALFRERLSPVQDMCRRHGKSLVLRDHSHSDYLTDLPPGTRLVDALRGHYALRQIVTIRNPIDSWLSMRESGFDSQLTGFEQYCERYLRFLDDYSDAAIWRYEDFVADPDQVLRAMCKELDLSFAPGFVDRAAKIILTGDSGRRPMNITALPRRDAPAGFLDRAVKLADYQTISKRFNYDADLTEPEASASRLST
jgi:hypothetical protein